MVSDVEVEVSDRGGRSRGGVLSLDDCRCPVCLEILMEPVKLPCTHTFCKDCFLESVDKATLCCPMCRRRVSTWARLNSKNNTLVDLQLWTQIQLCFPLQCQRRLNGQDTVAEDNPGVSVCFPRVSQPGEVKQEYEDQVTKLMEEKRVLDEEERRASEEYIQRLLAEEEELLREERRRHEDDEMLARQLSSQLNSAPVSQDNVGPANVTPAKKKKKKEVSAGQMDRFLCPRPANSSSSDCSFVANKENIILSQVERPIPKLDYYGSDPQPVSLSDPVEVPLHPRTHRGHLTGGGGPLSVKRKSSELETSEDEEVTVTKQGCPSFSSSSASSSSSSLEGGGFALPEAELLSRQQQEEEDRRLALVLQKELDQEEKQRATDRSKGSSDPYLLRQNRGGKVETTSSHTPTRSSRRTTKTPTPSSAKNSTPSASSVKTKDTSSSPSPSRRGSKQVTLTEMFSGLSN